MPPRLLLCDTCGRTLGTISRKRDHRGKPKDKLKLTDHAATVEHILFRGKYVECRCGQRTKVPDGAAVEFP